MGEAKRKSREAKSTAAVAGAFSKSSTIALAIGVILALALLGLFGVSNIIPSGAEAKEYWRQDRIALPLAVFMGTLAPCLVFVLYALAMRWLQHRLWPIPLALIGLICPLVWLHGMVLMDMFRFDGELSLGQIYLPPYPIFWISAGLTIVPGLVFLGLGKLRRMTKT